MPGRWLKRLLGRNKGGPEGKAEKAPGRKAQEQPEKKPEEQTGKIGPADPEMLREIREALLENADRRDREGLGSGVVAKQEGLTTRQVCDEFLFSFLASLVRKDVDITEKQAEVFRAALGEDLPKEKLLEMIREKEDPTLPELMKFMLPFTGVDLCRSKAVGVHYEVTSVAVAAAFRIFGDSLLAAGDQPDPEMEEKLENSHHAIEEFSRTIIANFRK